MVPCSVVEVPPPPELSGAVLAGIGGQPSSRRSLSGHAFTEVGVDARPHSERIFIELMTSDRKLKAFRGGSK